jgi:hypothetical protein
MAIAANWHHHDHSARLRLGERRTRNVQRADHVRFERLSAKAIVERDQRLAADTRTAVQIWLSEPPPGRSALDQKRRAADPGTQGISCGDLETRGRRRASLPR